MKLRSIIYKSLTLDLLVKGGDSTIHNQLNSSFLVSHNSFAPEECTICFDPGIIYLQVTFSLMHFISRIIGRFSFAWEYSSLLTSASISAGGVAVSQYFHCCWLFLEVILSQCGTLIVQVPLCCDPGIFFISACIGHIQGGVSDFTEGFSIAWEFDHAFQDREFLCMAIPVHSTCKEALIDEDSHSFRYSIFTSTTEPKGEYVSHCTATASTVHITCCLLLVNCCSLGPSGWPTPTLGFFCMSYSHYDHRQDWHFSQCYVIAVF